MDDSNYISVTVEGLDALNGALDNVSAKMRKDLNNAKIDCGLEIQQKSKQNLTTNGSIRTRTLINSIMILEGDSEFSDLEVGTVVVYSIYVENGTSRMKAKPYFTPAFLEAQDNYKSALNDLIK